MSENLWIKTFRDFWADPRNLIGPPGALVRRVMKCLWIALSIYVLFWIAGPSQVASWQLWMEDDALAEHIAWGFTFAAALCFAIVGYVAESTQPIRVPLIIPKFEFGRRWHEGWSIRSLHMHVPNIRVMSGSILAAALFLIALLGQWNYYLHDNMTTGGASVAALSGSDNRVAEAQAALNEHNTATAASLAIIDRAIRETSAGSPTGRSRLVAQRTALMTSAAATRTELQAELRAARAATVEVRSTSSDPRPVDGQVATATGMSRGLVSSLLDLLRSGVVEALLVMGAGLGLAGGLSRVGVPQGEADFAPAPPVDEVRVEPTDPAPEAPADPPPRSRYVLPVAEESDYAAAVAVGPRQHAPQEAASEPLPETHADAAVDDEPSVAPQEAQETPETLDPLAAAELENENA